MALSMDEQRMLAEIERRLAAEDPGLAAKLSSFRRPGPAVGLRSTRGRIIGSLFTVALLAVVSLMIYAMVPFRAHNPKSTLTPQTSSSASVSARAGSRPSAGAASPRASASAQGSTHATTAKAAAAKTATTAKTSKAKAAAPTS